MVLSCLVEPLVSPLIGQDTSGRRSSLLLRTRLFTTALACSATLAMAGASGEAKASELDRARTAERVAHSARNAHKKPDAIPYRELLETVFIRRDDLAPVSLRCYESPSFEQAALTEFRFKLIRDIAFAEDSSLGLGQRIDRLLGGALSACLRFSAGVHRSGVPSVA